ncbi:MAG: serine/threonine protein phosphatase [Armatimonadetes bacterium]|nr:serine/threonine protein phosphatase [Armatimonadota bacterium]
MRTFVIGDIHGAARALRQLLPQLRARAAVGDTLVFIGDYIDRGPDSRGVVDLVMKAPTHWPGPVVCLKGNHEALLLAALAGDPSATEIWRENGGLQTLTSYGAKPFERRWQRRFPPEHLEFLRGLRLWYEDEHAYYVHAGFRPEIPPEQTPEDDLLWIRGEFILSPYNWGKPVVFGHTPQFEDSGGPFPDLSQMRWRPLVRPEKIGVDTGCAYGGPLTALVLPEREFVEVVPAWP